MTDALIERYNAAGAVVGDDGIPQHFGDLPAEYEAALNAAVLLDRSHEARLRLDGDDRYPLLQRISTNDVLNLSQGSGRATIFTNPTGRVLDRVEVYAGEAHAMLVGGPGRAESLRSYLQRNIFFRDKVRLSDLTAGTRQFGLHGPQAEAVATRFAPEAAALSRYSYIPANIAGAAVMIARARPLTGSHFRIIVAAEQATVVWDTLTSAGADVPLRPAGSQLYNILRIRAGVPGAGRELSEEYIPLELGLWDEVSFAKGCYTGQEIIARMESRGKLAKTITSVRLEAATDSPADLTADGKRAGTLSSAVTAPDGVHYGIALVRPELAREGARFATASGIGVTVAALPGAQPPA